MKPVSARPAGSHRGLLVGAVAVLVLGLLVWAFHSVFSGATKKPRKQVVQQIVVLKPPPPPPPPKPEERPPEVKKEEVVKIPEPQPTPQPQDQPKGDPPASEQLGVVGEGTAGSDGFGLAARKGGTELIKLGDPAGGRSGYQFYVGRLQRHLERELARDEKLRSGDYRAVVRIWLSRDGRIERFDLTGPTGSAEADAAIRAALTALAAIPEPPPESLPQPVHIRITSRGAG